MRRRVRKVRPPRNRSPLSRSGRVLLPRGVRGVINPPGFIRLPAARIPHLLRLQALQIGCHEVDVIEQEKRTRGRWEREVDKIGRAGEAIGPRGDPAILNGKLRPAPAVGKLS